MFLAGSAMVAIEQLTADVDARVALSRLLPELLRYKIQAQRRPRSRPAWRTSALLVPDQKVQTFVPAVMVLHVVWRTKPHVAPLNPGGQRRIFCNIGPQ